MIIDSSALLAILLEEPEAEACLQALAAASHLRMSTASYVEVALKLDGLAKALDPELDSFITTLRIELVPLSAEQAMRAREANISYGRSNHPARLNFGDCLTYGLARTLDEPLLFKGNDFALTDLDTIRLDSEGI